VETDTQRETVIVDTIDGETVYGSPGGELPVDSRIRLDRSASAGVQLPVECTKHRPAPVGV